MTRERPPIQIPATPEYLLASFRELNRIAVSIGDADDDFELTPQTTLGDWSRASDFAPNRSFIRRMEAHQGLPQRPWSEWKAMLNPQAGRTVGEFCERLAALGVKRPAFEPIGFLGAKPCAAAGAFAAVRSILRDAGADADAITPSTELEPYLRRYFTSILAGPVADAAPGALPECRVTFSRPIATFRIACLLAIASAFLSVVAAARVDWLAAYVGALLMVFPVAGLGFLAAACIDERFCLTRYELGDLRTFKDLSRALAAWEPMSVG